MTQTVNAAVAVREETGPGALVAKYEGDFAAVLPEHIKAPTFVGLAIGALRRNPSLMQAATRNPGSFLGALLDCARLGHEPGTEQYYLVPFGGEVQGIEGYQGEVERIYRAGAATSVIAEVVRDNDTFVWTPGRHDTQNPPRWSGPQTRPFHDADWFGDRGDLKGVYAYAEMVGGAVSRVVVMGKAEVMKHKAEAKGASSPSSPWQKWEQSMWLKTGVHELQKWVPTSSEYRKEQLRAAAEVARETGPAVPPPPVPAGVHADTGEVVEAEFMPDDAA